MEPILIVLFLVGAGALWKSVSSRREAERYVPRPRPSAAVAPAEETAAGWEQDDPQAAPVAEPAPPVRAAARRRPAPAPPPAPTTPAEAPAPGPVERRKHPRIRSDQTFTITPFAGQPTMAQCCDLSAGGMRFGVVGCALRAGDLVRVTFNVGAETVSAVGSVLRIRELDANASEVSLEFVRLDPWATQLIEQALEAGA